MIGDSSGRLSNVLFVVAVLFCVFCVVLSFLKRPVHCKGLMGKQRDGTAGGREGKDGAGVVEAGLTM